MPPNPTLAKAADEILAVLRKYDLAALVTLQLPGHVQTVRELSPSWSCARLEDTPQGQCINVSAKDEDFILPEMKQHTIENTMAMLLTFEHQATQDTETMNSIVSAVVEQTGMNIELRITKGRG